jgi:hypothetical protein
MAMLADSVEVVIGVDTHKQTHTAAVVAAATGQTLANLTVTAIPAGYRQLLELADQHHRRVWAIESTGGYGAGLTRFLHGHQEPVVELDRPKRAARRHGAKSDPLDATRAAREALGRDQLAQPRATGPRAALSARLAARRSAVQAAGDAQRQLHALVIAAPEVLRERLRSARSTRQLVTACTRLRVHRDWDVETCSTAATLRRLARRNRRWRSFAQRMLIDAVDSPVSRLVSQSAASQIRVDHDQDRAAHHPVEGLDQVQLALRLGQRRPPRRSGHGGRSGRAALFPRGRPGRACRPSAAPAYHSR